MRRARLLITAAGVTGLLLVCAPPAQADTRVDFTLSPMNASGASGTATIIATDAGSLRVRLRGSGFIPNTPHAQHLHGLASARHFFCPPASVDRNGDGQVSTEEAQDQYGGLSIALTTRGDTSANSALALGRMPVADARGRLVYERTIPARAVPPGIARNLAHLHVVHHGIDVNGNGRYDLGGLGESVFARQAGLDGVPEEMTNPSTCGEATPVGAVETGGGTGTGVDRSLLALGGLALATSAGALRLRRRFADAG
jgi:hypothetical protein